MAPIFCGLRRRRWLGIRQGSQQIAPGWEDLVAGDGAQIGEEASAGPGLFDGPTPEVFGEFSDGVVGKGTQVQRRQHGGEVLLAMTEIVLEVVSLGFQDIEAFVFDLPPGAAGGGEFDDVIAVDR